MSFSIYNKKLVKYCDSKAYLRKEDCIKVVMIPWGVHTISKDCFKEVDIFSVVMSKSVEFIDSNGFINSGINEIKFVDGLRVINDYAFKGCKNLKTIRLPNTVSSIGVGAFADCINLTEVKLSSEIRELPPLAFSNCKNLKRVYVNRHIKYDESVFKGCNNVKIIDYTPIMINNEF
jgi:hypothetical protein